MSSSIQICRQHLCLLLCYNSVPSNWPLREQLVKNVNLVLQNTECHWQQHPSASCLAGIFNKVKDLTTLVQNRISEENLTNRKSVIWDSWITKGQLQQLKSSKTIIMSIQYYVYGLNDHIHIHMDKNLHPNSIQFTFIDYTYKLLWNLHSISFHWSGLVKHIQRRCCVFFF